MGGGICIHIADSCLQQEIRQCGNNALILQFKNTLINNEYILINK